MHYYFVPNSLHMLPREIDIPGAEIVRVAPYYWQPALLKLRRSIQEIGFGCWSESFVLS